jgi:hypothetical protein
MDRQDARGDRQFVPIAGISRELVGQLLVGRNRLLIRVPVGAGFVRRSPSSPVRAHEPKYLEERKPAIIHCGAAAWCGPPP